MPAAAAIRYVDVNSTNPVPPYASWATAANVIQDAVDAAVSGDEVLVTNGVYQTGGRAFNDGITNRVIVTNTITLRSVNGPAATIIQGYQNPTTIYGFEAARGIYLTNGAMMEGFTITGGGTAAGYASDSSGGGIHCMDNTVVISNCVITGNAAWLYGGGVYGGTYRNCVISNNTAELSNSGYGGGAFGALIYNCFIVGNRANFGGGVGQSTVFNSLISDNNAGSTGGGLSWSVLVNCTVTDNSSRYGGGGAYECITTNSIVYHNTALEDPNHRGYYVSAFYNSCTTPLPAEGTNNITDEPLLASMSHISSTSPCLNAGDPTIVVGTDVDGDAWGNPPSIGCNEFTVGAGDITAQIHAPYTNAALGYPLSLTAKITGQVSASVWDFGDGTILSNRPFATRVWTSPGIYTVVLRAFNATYPSGISATTTVHVLSAPIHHVALTSTNPQSPYLTWATAATNIQDAIDAAYVGGLVTVSNGVYDSGYRYNPTIGGTRVELGRPLLVKSVNGPAVTVIDGGNSSRCVMLTNGATLSGFTLTRGNEEGGYGAGAYCWSADSVVTNCVIATNTASRGGGIFGGKTIHSVLSKNNAYQEGGGAYGSTLLNCLIISNTASYGAGVAQCDINHSTIVGNTAWQRGGGTYFGQLDNSIIYYNQAISFPLQSDTYIPSLNYCCTTYTDWATSFITNPPAFLNLAAGDFRLSTNSPCRNAGDDSNIAVSYDLNGTERSLEGRVDIGAYEFVPPPPPTPAAPFAFTGESTEIHATQARVNGFATPNGTNTTAWFEWGQRGAFTATSAPIDWPSTYGVRHQSQTLSNLFAQTSYQYRLVTSNIFGVVTGATRYFSTGSRVTVWSYDNYYGQRDQPVNLTNAVAIAIGETHSLVLKNDGSLVTWGNFFVNSPSNIPPDLTNVAVIAAGNRQSLALLTDRTVRAWGSYNNVIEGGPATVPANLSNVVALSAYDHTIALHDDGTITTWGAGYRGQTNVPPGLSNVVEVAAGQVGSLALHANGTVSAWGNHYYYFNGFTTLTPLTVPAGLTNVVGIEFSANTALAIRADGTVVAWGENYSNITNVPPYATNIVTLSSIGGRVLGIKSDGKMISWGNLDSTQSNVVAQLEDAIDVESGYVHTLTLGNMPPTVQAETLGVSYNSDRTITLTGYDMNFEPLRFRITTLPALGTLYQYDNGSRGPAIISTNTIVTDPDNRILFAPATNTTGTPYTSFQFAAHDGLVTSAPAIITLNVIAAAPYAHTLPVLSVRTNSATFQGMATPNGLASTAWFEWGTSNTFDLSSPPQPIGNGLDVVHVSAEIAGLAARQTARCRLVVSNQAGVVYGASQQFLPGGRVRAWGYNGQLETNVPTKLSAGSISAGIHSSLAVDTLGNITAWGGLNVLITNVPPNLTNVAAAISGWYYGAAILTNRNVVAWGRNDYGETNVPSNLSNVVSVAAEYQYGAALQADGRVRIWGQYNPANSNIITSLSNVVAMSFGYGGFFLLDNGTVHAIGEHPDPQYQMPAGLSNIVALASHGGTLALRRDGTVVSWGGAPPVPPGLTNVIAIDVGLSHALALREDGTVVLWGTIANGGTDISAQLTNVAAIASGYSHNLALLPNTPPVASSLTIKTPPASQIVVQLPASDPDSDTLQVRIQSLPLVGALYQYTNGTPTVLVTNAALVTDSQRRVIFVPVTNVIADPYATFTYSASDGELETPSATVTIAIVSPIGIFTRPATDITLASAKLNGFISPNGFPTTAWFEWGTNTSYGQSTTPMDTGSGIGVIHLSQPIAGLSQGQPIHFRLVASNASQTIYGESQRFVTGGKVFAWGDNSSGQSSVPANVGAIVSLAGGLSHSAASCADGTVAAWGNNTHGQTNIPVGLNGVTVVAAGGFHNLALLTNGNVVAWGRNNLGQTSIPASASNVVAIAAGGQHSIALRSDGSLVAWGDNSQGQRNISASLTNIVGIAAGWYHNVALRGDGTVTAWGANTYGQTNVPAGLTNVIWVGAGLYHNLALRSDGKMTAWGLNSSGQTNIPASATNIVAAAGGGSHNLAMQTNGALTGWGYNFFGQSTPPPSLSNVVNFAAGGSHSLALLPNRLPVAFDQSVAGYPNMDLLVTLAGSDADNDAVSYRISALPTAGAVYQYSGGSRGAQIVTANTSVADPLARIFFAPAADQAGSPHATFGFTAGDGFALSSLATVTVNIVLPVAPVLDTTASSITTNGAFRLIFTGATNAAYRVWASTNLFDWEHLGTASSLAPGQFLFFDTTATNHSRRFYRVTAP